MLRCSSGINKIRAGEYRIGEKPGRFNNTGLVFNGIWNYLRKEGNLSQLKIHINLGYVVKYMVSSLIS